MQNKITNNLNKLKNNFDDTVSEIKYENICMEYNNIKTIFGFSLLYWVIDYFGCKFITPYHVHWIFHILIGITGFKIINFK